MTAEAVDIILIIAAGDRLSVEAMDDPVPDIPEGKCTLFTSSFCYGDCFVNELPCPAVGEFEPHGRHPTQALNWVRGPVAHKSESINPFQGVLY